MFDNSRRDVLRGIATTGVGLSVLGGTAATAGATSGTIVVDDRFHFDIDGWEVGTDLPDDENGEPIDYHVTHSNTGSASGWWGGCVEMGLDGLEDDGTVWLQRPVEVDPNTTYDVTLQFAGHNIEESFNRIVSGNAYLDTVEPQTEEDLLGWNSDTAIAVQGDLHEADDEWRYYGTTGTFECSGSSTAWLAFGMNIFWETPYWTNRFDDVLLEMTPQ